MSQGSLRKTAISRRGQTIILRAVVSQRGRFRNPAGNGRTQSGACPAAGGGLFQNGKRRRFCALFIWRPDTCSLQTELF